MVSHTGLPDLDSDSKKKLLLVLLYKGIIGLLKKIKIKKNSFLK